MRIEIDRLEELGHRFSKIYQVDELPFGETDVRLIAPVEIDGIVWREGNEIGLHGELSAEVETSCGRCLKPVRLPINGKFKERFVSSVNWRSEEQHELKTEDLNLAVFNGETLDIDELVREQILLEVPGHVLCREDCQGLCPICGVDKNLESCRCEEKRVDSRWQKLKELQI